ncbi:hypothetical protein ABFS82_14G148400 [Erythranthe guttata]
MAAALTVLGYEYHYNFSIDEEVASSCKHTLHPGKTTILFEIRTDFVVKTIEGGDQIIDSERFSSDFPVDCDSNGPDPCLTVLLDMDLSSRWEDYWMTRDEINKFNDEAFAFVRENLRDVDIMIPVAVDFRVVTVQREDEALGGAMERAVRPEKLIPLTVCLWGLFDRELRVDDDDPDFYIFLVENLKRVRVENVDQEGLVKEMEVCGICSTRPVIGDQISKLYYCDHVFHSHCIVRFLLEENRCPSCRSQAYDPMIGAPCMNNAYPLPMKDEQEEGN